MEFVSRNNNKHLLICVHGLNGSGESWKGNIQRFVENLKKQSIIKENFDIALFTYTTKIFQLSRFRKFINIIRGFLSNRPKEDLKGFNVGIEQISRPLESEIRGLANNYETISFMTHSMGGLVTKSALTWMQGDVLSKIPLFISLSVPHIGSQLTRLGELFGNNPQVIDLRAMGEFTTSLNERFSNLKPQPKIIYQSGNQDTVVPRASAIPANVPGQFTESTSDDHFSVLLIKNDSSNLLFQRILKELEIAIQPYRSINIGVPEGALFQQIIEIIASKLKISIDLGDFDAVEKNARLREGQIHSASIEEVIRKVGELAVNSFPAYAVKKVTGSSTYKLKKIPGYGRE